MDANQIEAAVKNCVSQATTYSQPYRAVNEFLSSLKKQGWDENARLEVQTQVLAALKRRRESAGQ